MKESTGSACIHRVALDVREPRQQEGAALIERHPLRVGERGEREQRSGRVDDCEYRFLSLFPLFSFFSALFSPFFPLSCRCSFTRAGPGHTGTDGRGGTGGEGGRQAGAVPSWAGFAEATGGQTDGRTERQTDRSSVSETLFKRAADRQRARIMAAACLSRAR